MSESPNTMGGATRMHDPSEAAHDRIRRRCMNVAFVVIALLLGAQCRLLGMTGADWWRAVLLVAAGVPAGLAVKLFELRFKMARDERRLVLRELPAGKFLVYAALVTVAFVLAGPLVTWALLGVWGYDFVTYYHDRPERLRHLYAVMKTVDEIRGFPIPWIWAAPAVVWEIIRIFLDKLTGKAF